MNDSTLAPEMLTSTEVLASVGNNADALFHGLGRRILHAQFSEDGSAWSAEKGCVEAWIADEPCGHDRTSEVRRFSVEDYRNKKPVAFSPIHDITDPRWVMTMNSPLVFDGTTPDARAELFLDFIGFMSPLRTVAQMTDCGFQDCDWITHNEGKPRSEWSHTIRRFEMDYLEGAVDATGSGEKAFVYVDVKESSFTHTADIRAFVDNLGDLQQELLTAADAIDAVRTTTDSNDEGERVDDFTAPPADRAAWDAEHGEDLAALRPAWADDRDPVDGFGFGGPGFRDVAFESAPFEIYGSMMRWVRSGVYNTGSRTIDWDSDARLMLGDLAFRSIADLGDYLELLREGADAMAALHDNE